MYAILRLQQRYIQRSAAVDWNLSDVYLVSYPKSGNTWVSLILANILKQLRTDCRRIDYFSLHDYIPDIHVNADRIQYLTPPRIVKTHESFDEWYDRVNLKGKGFRFPRTIYLVRDGRDVMVSYYHYVKGVHGYNGDFEEFLSDRLIKRGEWSEHIRGWIIDNHVLEKKRILLIKYEDLHADTMKQIKNIVDFIGFEVSEGIVEAAITFSDIKNIREVESKYGEPAKYAAPEYRFARKGTTGNVERNLRKTVDVYYNSNIEVFRFLGYE
jgi:hypothetical protein